MSSSSGPGEAPAGPGLGVISFLLVPQLHGSLEQTSSFPGLGARDPQVWLMWWGGPAGEEPPSAPARCALLGWGRHVRSLLVWP